MARATADTRLALGDEVRIPPVRVADRTGRPAAPAREFEVVHEDDALLCIDKPAGVAVHGGSGESFGVIEQLRRARPGAFLELVHRLDKETSGLLLVAKTRPALVALQNDLRARQPARAVVKTYAALVIGALAGGAQGHRRRLAQGRRCRWQPSRARRRRRRRARASLDQHRPRRAPARRFQPARRRPEDRPHAPDPGPPRRRRPCDRRRSQVRRLQPQPRARPRHAGAAAALRPDVPARTAPALRPSDDRHTDRSSRRHCLRRATRCSRPLPRKAAEAVHSYARGRPCPMLPRVSAAVQYESLRRRVPVRWCGAAHSD